MLKTGAAAKGHCCRGALKFRWVSRLCNTRCPVSETSLFHRCPLMRNGVRRVADRSHGHLRMRDHAWMVAAGNVVNLRLGTRRKLELDVGRNDLVGVPYDVPGGNRLPSHSFRRFVRCATFCERALRSG